MTWKNCKQAIFIVFIVLFSYIDLGEQTPRPKVKQRQKQKDISAEDDASNDNVDTNSDEKAGNPGLRFRVTKNGVDYITKTFGDIINQLIPVMDVPDMEQEFGNNGYVKLSNLHVQNFKPADSFNTDMISPNKIVWTMDNMDLGLKGDIDGEYNGKSASGQFDTLITGAKFVITVLFSKDTEGKGTLHLNAIDCKVTMKNFDFNVYNMGDRLQQLFTQYKKLVVNFLKPKITDQLCKKVKDMINNNMNEQLSVAGHLQPLSAAKSLNHNQTANGGVQLPQQFQDIMNNMYIDYSLTKDPLLNPKYMDIWSKGEISSQGSGGTPFYPATMNDQSSDMMDKMIYVSISDYLMNSLLYNSYQHKLLNLKFNKDSAPDMANFFKVNQCTELCLGAGFPELSKSYSDYDYEYQFDPSEAPKVTFSNSHAKLQAKGIITLVGKKNRTSTEFLKHDFAVDCDIRPFVENSLIKGDVTVNDMRANLIKTSLQNFDQKRLNDLIKMSKLLLQSLGNKAFKQGVPIPSADMIKLINPQLNLMNRHIRLDSDVELNKVAIVHKIGNSILSGG